MTGKLASLPVDIGAGAETRTAACTVDPSGKPNVQDPITCP
jgi:hypothetical protein